MPSIRRRETADNGYKLPSSVRRAVGSYVASTNCPRCVILAVKQERCTEWMQPIFAGLR
jgi:hypothetical protein